jgi:hypothetical protein
MPTVNNGRLYLLAKVVYYRYVPEERCFGHMELSVVTQDGRRPCFAVPHILARELNLLRPHDAVLLTVGGEGLVDVNETITRQEIGLALKWGNMADVRARLSTDVAATQVDRTTLPLGTCRFCGRPGRICDGVNLLNRGVIRVDGDWLLVSEDPGGTETHLLDLYGGAVCAACDRSRPYGWNLPEGVASCTIKAL